MAASNVIQCKESFRPSRTLVNIAKDSAASMAMEKCVRSTETERPRLVILVPQYSCDLLPHEGCLRDYRNRAHSGLRHQRFAKLMSEREPVFPRIGVGG